MDRQCSSCGGFCKKSGCERENTAPPQHKEPEPVAWKMKGVPAFATSRPNDTDSIKWQPLYTAPPQRKEWVGLTDGEREQIEIKANDKSEMTAWEYAHRVGNFTEAKLKEKNT